MKVHIKTKYNDEDCEVVFGRYTSGEICIDLRSEQFGEPMARATYSLVPYGYLNLDLEREVYIKDHAENEGIHDALVIVGILDPTFVPRKLEVNFVTIYVCRLSQRAIDELKQQERDRHDT